MTEKLKIYECDFFGHEWQSEGYHIGGYTLHWCRWCSRKTWRKEDD